MDSSNGLCYPLNSVLTREEIILHLHNPEESLMDLVGIQMEDSRKKRMMTVLRRQGGTWSPTETGKLVDNFKTPIHGHPEHPEYIIADGVIHQDDIQIVLGVNDFELKMVEGMDNPRLPFVPSWAI